MLRIVRYGNSRFWALYDGPDLVVVTVYKRGAREVQRRLEAQPRAGAAAAAQAAAVEAAARPGIPARARQSQLPPPGALPRGAAPHGGQKCGAALYCRGRSHLQSVHGLRSDQDGGVAPPPAGSATCWTYGRERAISGNKL